MRPPPLAALDADAIGRIGDASGEPDWLRDAARELVEPRRGGRRGPTGQEEEWRRTDARRHCRGDGQLLMDMPRLRPTTLPAGAAEAGVIFTDLRDAVRDHPSSFGGRSARQDGSGSHAHFWALAQAALDRRPLPVRAARRRRRRDAARAYHAAQRPTAPTFP